MENSSASPMFMVIIRIIMDREMLMMISTSSINVGSGITKNNTMTTTINDMALLSIRFIVYWLLLPALFQGGIHTIDIHQHLGHRVVKLRGMGRFSSVEA